MMEFFRIRACLPLCLFACAGLFLAGCETTRPASVQAAPATRLVDGGLLVPVAIPALSGRIDSSRPEVSQSVIVEAGQPATFRVRVFVRRPQAGAELRVFAGEKIAKTVPAAVTRAGDPPVEVVIALPPGNRTGVTPVRIALHPASAEAVFELSGPTVVIGESVD
jgi:hypothetical protein